MCKRARMCSHVDTYGGQRLIMFSFITLLIIFEAGSHSDPGASLLAGQAGQKFRGIFLSASRL